MSHKIIVDICERSGADESNSLEYGVGPSVVYVVQIEENEGKTITIIKNYLIPFF